MGHIAWMQGKTQKNVETLGPGELGVVAKLKEALTVLNVSIDRIGNARSLLTDEAIGQLGRTVTDSLMKLRDCSSSARQLAPERQPQKQDGRSGA